MRIKVKINYLIAKPYRELIAFAAERITITLDRLFEEEIVLEKLEMKLGILQVTFIKYLVSKTLFFFS